MRLSANENRIVYHAIDRDSAREQYRVLRVVRENGRQVQSLPVAFHKTQTIALADMRHRNAREWQN